MTSSRNAARSEEGYILLFALIFLTVIAFLVAALTDQADGGFRATVALRQVQATQYSADAAVQEAMSALPSIWTSWPVVVSPPTTAKCPTSQFTSNPATDPQFVVPGNPTGLINNQSIQANCTYLTAAQPRTVEISACPSSYGAVQDCPTPLLRAFVTLSQTGNNAVYVQINDWSVLYGSNS